MGINLKQLDTGRGTFVDTEDTSVLEGSKLVVEAGSGITAGTGTVYASGVSIAGGVRKTSILVDLTGLDSDSTEGDIIGVSGTSNPCHFGRVDLAQSGTVLAGRCTCLETPAGGEVDIDIYAADEATGVTDGAVGDLTETALLAAAADWAAQDVKEFSAYPSDGQYIYLTVGTASTPTAGTYTAGKFLIELYGYNA